MPCRCLCHAEEIRQGIRYIVVASRVVDQLSLLGQAQLSLAARQVIGWAVVLEM